METITLQEQYQTLRERHPRMRIRDAARALNVSELELLELQLGAGVVRLEDNWKALLKEVVDLGYVMALTRNEHAVHERKGVYDNVSFMKNHNMGVAVNEDIDLRLFMDGWVYGYAVRMESGKHVLHGLQFFNGFGEAVHKIYLTKRSNPQAYANLVERYRAADQRTPAMVERRPPSAGEAPEEKPVDAEAFRREWLALKDTHDFFPLLRKYDLERTRALRLAPAGHAQRLDNRAVERFFTLAAERELPIMVFVGNDGCLQIHTGPVHKIMPLDHWFNIMDPEFNLHLDTSGIAETWLVRKPTADGIVTSLEVYDAAGELIVQCFGKRKPGRPELPEWQALAEELSAGGQD